MSITISKEFYAGTKSITKKNIFGGTFKDYQFTLDIAYKDISFQEGAKLLRKFMSENNIKVGYFDYSADFGGGYSLCKRYTFVNKNGNIITKKQTYSF